MGVKFSTINLTISDTDSSTKNYQVIKDLTPIISITRIIPEGKSQKVIQQYISSASNGGQVFSTIWQPIGQEGWTIKVQAKLWYKDGYDGISDWIKLNACELIYVDSNCVNESGEVDTSNHRPYHDLPDGSMWYVDHILISSVSGVPNCVTMDLTLIRCWGDQ